MFRRPFAARSTFTRSNYLREVSGPFLRDVQGRLLLHRLRQILADVRVRAHVAPQLLDLVVQFVRVVFRAADGVVAELAFREREGGGREGGEVAGQLLGARGVRDLVDNAGAQRLLGDDGAGGVDQRLHVLRGDGV